MIGRLRIMWAALPFGLMSGATFVGCAAFGTYLKPNPWTFHYAGLVVLALSWMAYGSATFGFLRYGEYGICGDDPKAELGDIRLRMHWKHLLACCGTLVPQIVACEVDGYWQLVSLLSLFFVGHVFQPSRFLDEIIVERENYANRKEFLQRLGEPRKRRGARTRKREYRRRVPR
ncbi:MAG: hypothetical protein KIS66_06245 [Fimbriimonadaceae bacterium]|nr:hypothetical protein [Fimbriimonadaceae bacterium]